jgi:hypothetical protein
MKILGSPCGGCCTAPCSDCCDVDAPTTFEVDVTLTDDECGVCDSFLSGVYTLTRVGSQCVWRYTEGSDNGNLAWCDPGCTDESLCYYVVRREVQLVIAKRVGVCYLELTVLVGGRYYPSEPGNPCNTSFGAPYRKFANYWLFVKTIADGTDCTTISAESIPLDSSGCKCLNLLTDCDPGYMHWLCDASPVDAVLTAV